MALRRSVWVTVCVGALAGIYSDAAAVRAQNTNKALKRIAFLPDLVPVTLADWRAEMRGLDWIEGRNFTIIQSGIEHGSFIQTKQRSALWRTRQTSFSPSRPPLRSPCNTQRRQFRL